MYSKIAISAWRLVAHDRRQINSALMVLKNVSTAAAVAIVHYQPEFAALSTGKLVSLGGRSALHLIYFVFGVNQKAMLNASAIYARQLVLSAEAR